MPETHRLEPCQTFLHAVARSLALVHQDQLALTPRGQLEVGGLLRLAQFAPQLVAGRTAPSEAGRTAPRSESKAPGISWLIGLLERAGLVETTKQRFHLTPAARLWLDHPPALQIQRLREVWWFNPDLNTRWFGPHRRRKTLQSHWRTLVRGLCGCVAGLPTARWTTVAQVQTDLSQAGLLETVGQGRTLPNVQARQRRQADGLIHLILSIVLPGLGLVEQRQTGLEPALRPTSEGVAWLHAALARAQLLNQPSGDAAVQQNILCTDLVFPAPDRPACAVHDPSDAGLSVTVHFHAPARCTFDLAHLGELETTGPPARYRLTRAGLSHALEWGYSIPDALYLLTHHTGQPLAPEVAAQLETWRDATATLGREPGYRLSFPDRATLRALRRREPFRRRTRPLASAREAWVAASDAPGLWRYLRRLGYDLESAHQRSGAAAIERREPLPLVQWLALLRTYQALRQRVPGLADLDAAGQIATVTTALSDEERTAVERLLDSQVARLQQALGPKNQPIQPDAAASEPTTRLVLDQLKAAIQAETPLTLTYIDTQGQLTQRRVRPLQLEERWGQTYLLAFCELRQDERHFRLDRIVAVDDDHLTSSMT